MSGHFLTAAGVCTACSETSLAESCSGTASTNHLGCSGNNFLSAAGTCTACTGTAYQCISTSIHTKC